MLSRIADGCADFHDRRSATCVGHHAGARYNGHRLIKKGNSMLGWCFLLASATLAAEPEPQAFIVHSAAGEPAPGTIQSLAGDWAVNLAGEKGAKIPAGDLISLRRKDIPLPTPPAGRQVIFANGDRLSGDVLAIEKDQVRFRATLGTGHEADQELTIPLSALAVIWFQAPPAHGDPTRQWLYENRRKDKVLLNNGDTVVGSVVGMKAITQPLVFQDDKRETSIEASHLIALAMNTDLARSLRPRGTYARLVLVNGCRLALLSAQADDRELRGKTLFGSEVRIGWDQIVALDIRQGKAVYLSDLKPKSYEHTPYLGLRWNYEMDRSVAGLPLRLNGSQFDKGIGLHSESRLTFALGGNYRRFESLVGLDDQTGQGGNVRIAVLADGKPKDLGPARDLASATGPHPLRVDVTGVKELTLVVEFGPGGDIHDHVDWADARLIKE
jgi:hypothetical protein